MNIQAALVHSILEKWESYDWTIQGFGFARTKIANVGRIHVWDSRLRTDLVSDVHTHPWPLKSTIISGELINQRFIGESPVEDMPMRYMHSYLTTGEGGGLIGDPTECNLRVASTECYTCGGTYSQEPQEIHRTIAQDGTVTLLERPQGPPLEKALVYWPAGMEWISAHPRPQENPWELARIIKLALARWYAA